MLKIIEDKQDEFIEKYNFECYKYGSSDDYYIKISKNLIIDQQNLKIYTPTKNIDNSDLEMLYDLIKDGLIEKEGIENDITNGNQQS